jgi:hypothetical protein
VGIEEFITRARNPFTGGDIEIVRTNRIVPPPTGSYVRLHAEPVEAALAGGPGCRVGGELLPGNLIAQLDFAELQRVHGGSIAGPQSGYLRLIANEDRMEMPSLEFLESLPSLGPPGPGRRLVPELVPIDVEAENDFESNEDGFLTHRVGWARPNQSYADWTGHAIRLELEAVNLTGSPESLREAERRGVDVVGIIRGASKWRLLWQVASDDELEMNWGDGGRLFILIRDEDLANQRFDRAELVIDWFS